MLILSEVLGYGDESRNFVKVKFIGHLFKNMELMINNIEDKVFIKRGQGRPRSPVFSCLNR